MTDLFNISKNSEFGLKSNPQLKSTGQVLMTNNLVEQRQNNDPLMKTTYPIYLYKPPFGYPRNINPIFLRNLSNNPYVFSVIKAITDQAAESKWEICVKKGVDMTDELENSQGFITEFFKNPNSDNESFAQLLRKVIPDMLVLDSGVFNKVYNKKSELLQLRVIDGGAILKNPDRHGSLAQREEIIFGDGYFGAGAGQGYERQTQAYKVALDRYNSYGYTEQAAYYQFAYGINYSVPIPYGRKEIIYMMENPSTETVYSRVSALQSAVDIVLNLIYSSKASLDLFLNANIPTGIVQLAEAAQEDTEAFQKNLYHQQYSGFDEYGFQRKINGKMPVVGNPNVNFIPLNFKNSESQLLEIQQWFTKVLWSCFGVTAEEMGFTENSNKAVSESQTKAAARKAVKPRLTLIANYLNDQVLPELPNGDLFEFRFDEFDINEEIQKNNLYQLQINNGIKSSQMVAEEEGVDLNRLKQDKEENMSMAQPEQDKDNNFNKDSKDDKTEVKSVFDLGDRIVLTGTSVEEILSQAVDLAEKKKIQESEIKEEPETIPEVIEEGSEERLEQEQEVTNQEEFKSNKKPKTMPKEAATDIVMSDFEKEYNQLVRDVIKSVK